MTPDTSSAPGSVPSGAAARGPDEDAPPRRQGRDCGYENRDALTFARRRLGAALTDLARDRDPEARRVGAELAAEAAAALDAVAARAEASTSYARRVAAEVERRLPRLDARLAAARASAGRSTGSA